MTGLEKRLKTTAKQTKVYLLVNNGFYDAIQNRTAIKILWNWCEKIGFKRGFAIGIGGGEMVQMAPLGKGPSANLGKAMEKFVNAVKEKKTEKTIYVEPNFPRVLYKMAAHMSWRTKARKNGLKAAELKKRESGFKN